MDKSQLSMKDTKPHILLIKPLMNVSSQVLMRTQIWRDKEFCQGRSRSGSSFYDKGNNRPDSAKRQKEDLARRNKLNQKAKRTGHPYPSQSSPACVSASQTDP
jgi:hypothetical protein